TLVEEPVDVEREILLDPAVIVQGIRGQEFGNSGNSGTGNSGTDGTFPSRTENPRQPDLLNLLSGRILVSSLFSSFVVEGISPRPGPKKSPCDLHPRKIKKLGCRTRHSWSRKAI